MAMPSEIKSEQQVTDGDAIQAGPAKSTVPRGERTQPTVTEYGVLHSRRRQPVTKQIAQPVAKAIAAKVKTSDRYKKHQRKLAKRRQGRLR